MTANQRNVPFDPATESLLQVVVNSVAAIRNEDPTRLPPLGESLDIECLERLVDSSPGSSIRRAHVTFDYADVGVTVDATGEILFEWD